MRTYKIYLIRSSYTKGNLEGRYIGHTDEPLSDEGLNLVYEMLENHTYPDAEVVLSSPLKRCMQTASLLYPHTSPVAIPDVIECNFGEFDGHTADELAKYPEFADWLQGGSQTAPPHGESGSDFAKRVLTGFAKIVDGMLASSVHETALITHAGVIMTILEAYGLPEMPMHMWQHSPVCGFCLNIIPSVWATSKKIEVLREIPSKPLSEYSHDDFFA